MHLGQFPGSVDWEFVPLYPWPWALVPLAAVLSWQGWGTHVPWHSPAIKLQGAALQTAHSPLFFEREGLSSPALVLNTDPTSAMPRNSSLPPALLSEVSVSSTRDFPAVGWEVSTFRVNLSIKYFQRQSSTFLGKA